MEDQRIKEILIEKNKKFKELFLRHQEFEQKLKTFTNKSFKTDHDLVEEKKLKKKKLRIKDAMQKYIFEYRNRINS
jgi:uncharacterized protein YdcH (DUF465 family)